MSQSLMPLWISVPSPSRRAHRHAAVGNSSSSPSLLLPVEACFVGVIWFWSCPVVVVCVIWPPAVASSLSGK
ncbi:hypothetical protein AHAS_Ahas18G0228700 [Arachis hypogaea]